MFILSKIRDSVCVEPSSFNKPIREAVLDELNRKYCNKIIPDIGLALKTFDIVSMNDPIVHPGVGSYYVKVVFQMAVFRPFIGEIMEGKIRASTPDGLKLCIDFFQDILVPPEFMPENCVFESEQLWVWNYEGESIYLDLNEKVRFRVVNYEFTEPMPNVMHAMKTGVAVDAPQEPPYSLLASIGEPGLGCVRWWEES